MTPTLCSLLSTFLAIKFHDQSAPLLDLAKNEEENKFARQKQIKAGSRFALREKN
jgi:hypothetical protein